MKSYQQQRASPNGGTSKQHHTLWRDHTLAPNPGVQSEALLP